MTAEIFPIQGAWQDQFSMDKHDGAPFEHVFVAWNNFQ